MSMSKIEMQDYLESFDAVKKTFRLTRLLKQLNLVEYVGGELMDEQMQGQEDLNEAILRDLCNSQDFLLLPEGKTFIDENGQPFTLPEDFHATGIRAKGTVPDIYGRSVSGEEDDLIGFFEKLSIEFVGASNFAGYEVIEYNSNVDQPPKTPLGRDADDNEVALMFGGLFRPYDDVAIRPYIYNTWEDGGNVYHRIDAAYAFLLGSDPAHPDPVMQQDIYQYFSHNESDNGFGTYSAPQGPGLYNALYHFPLSARIKTNLSEIDPDDERFGWSGGIDTLRPDCYAWMFQTGSSGGGGSDDYEPIVIPRDVAPPDVPFGGAVPVLLALGMLALSSRRYET